MSESTNPLMVALLEVQRAAPNLQRSAINPHFKNKYVPLERLVEVVLPLLHEQGVLLVQSPTIVGGEPALRTILTHVESGAAVEDAMLLVLDKENPQGQGSAITYARRYALMSMLGLIADLDDDAEAASTSQAPPARASRAKTVRAVPDAPQTQVPAF